MKEYEIDVRLGGYFFRSRKFKRFSVCCKVAKALRKKYEGLGVGFYITSYEVRCVSREEEV